MTMDKSTHTLHVNNLVKYFMSLPLLKYCSWRSTTKKKMVCIRILIPVNNITSYG